MFAWKALSVNTCDIWCVDQLFLAPAVTQEFAFQHNVQLRAMISNWWKYLLIDVTRVYVLAMIWELALKAALGMKRI